MSDETTTLDVRGLDKLLRALKQKAPQTRVGVLGSKVTRTKAEQKAQGPNNAEIGAAHEFGSPSRGLPQRSFLRMPISERLEKEMESSGAFTEDSTKKVMQEGSIIPWMKKVAVAAEKCVDDAFDTQGFGTWPAWKDPNYTNNSGMVLVDTTQLRRSITSEVK